MKDEQLKMNSEKYIIALLSVGPSLRNLTCIFHFSLFIFHLNHFSLFI